MIPLVIGAALVLTPKPRTSPSPPPRPQQVLTRADYIAGRLAADPVYITDDAPRDITAEDAARIRAAVRRMPVPTYAAVVTETDGQHDPQAAPDRLIALLQDKLGRDGVYVVVPSDGIGVTAEQFGENLPLTPAEREVTFSEPYNAGAARVIERFVDDLRSGQAQQRYEKSYARSQTGWEPKPYREADDDADLAEQAGVYSGMGAALLAAAWILLSRRRDRTRRDQARSDKARSDRNRRATGRSEAR